MVGISRIIFKSVYTIFFYFWYFFQLQITLHVYRCLEAMAFWLIFFSIVELGGLGAVLCSWFQCFCSYAAWLCYVSWFTCLKQVSAKNRLKILIPFSTWLDFKASSRLVLNNRLGNSWAVVCFFPREWKSKIMPINDKKEERLGRRDGGFGLPHSFLARASPHACVLICFDYKQK